VAYVHAGFAKGRLSLEYTGLVNPAAVLKYHPEFQARLDEILQHGWTYYLIETRGRSVSDVDIDQTYRMLSDGLGYSVYLGLGEEPPGVTSVPEVTEFRINISTKSFPRAVTVDLTKDTITYIHEAFWEWQEEWKGDSTKLLQATEVYEVAKWLLDVKNMKLVEGLDMERFRKLSGLFAVKKEEPEK
jgi:hypothetical protein